MNARKRRPRWRVTGIILAVVVMAGVVIFFQVRRHLPRDFDKDIRAGLAAREIADPDERLRKYHEERYGPLSDPLNRQKVFMGYFDLEHIKAMQFMVQHIPEDRRAATIQASARWIENYRNSLTPQERAALQAQFQGPEGQAMLKQATGQYNSQDVQYRGQTVPVISQLLQTIYHLQTQ